MSLREKPRCLVACPEPPLPTRGGGIAILQTLHSLSHHFAVDYLGQPVPDACLPNGARCLTNKRTWPASSILRQKINVAFWGWHDIPSLRRYLANLEVLRYDLCFLEFPWYCMCASLFAKWGIPVITRFHNVESDIILKQIKREKNPSYLLRLPHVSRMERQAIENSQGLVFLTEEDQARYRKLFPNLMSRKTSRVIPIAVAPKKRVVPDLATSRVFLCTATLNYGPNREGVLWLAEKVWPHVPKGFRLIIAGCNPDRELKKRLSARQGVETFYDIQPDSMDALYCNSSFSIAPVFWGSGMKVKIAEALAAGVIPIGTPQAFIGYATASGKDCFVFRNEKEAVETIQAIAAMPLDQIQDMSRNSYDLYQREHALSTSACRYKNIVDGIA